MRSTIFTAILLVVLTSFSKPTPQVSANNHPLAAAAKRPVEILLGTYYTGKWLVSLYGNVGHPITTGPLTNVIVTNEDGSLYPILDFSGTFTVCQPPLNGFHVVGTITISSTSQWNFDQIVDGI